MNQTYPPHESKKKTNRCSDKFPQRKTKNKTVELTSTQLEFDKDHDICPDGSQQSGTTRPMHLLLQHGLKQTLSYMHGQHPATTIGQGIIFNTVLGLILGEHACASTTPSPWPTETAFAVAVGHCGGVTQAFTLEQIN